MSARDPVTELVCRVNAFVCSRQTAPFPAQPIPLSPVHLTPIPLIELVVTHQKRTGACCRLCLTSTNVMSRTQVAIHSHPYTLVLCRIVAHRRQIHTPMRTQNRTKYFTRPLRILQRMSPGRPPSWAATVVASAPCPSRASCHKTQSCSPASPRVSL